MKCTAISIFVLAVTSQLHAQEYELKIESNGEVLPPAIRLSIKDNTAIAKVDEIVENFDLKDQRWQHDESKQWVTLSQSETWAKQSKEKADANKDSIPEAMRSFILWTISPTFTIEATETTLTLTSGQVDYKIVGLKAGGEGKAYFQYARLNAYKKAMTERKLPPFAELLVIDELEKRQLLPTTMEIKVPGVPDSPTIKMHITAIEK